MAATPRLTAAMMQGGGVYDSIIGQTSTPRASEKVLMFLDRITPSEPVDNVVVWTDDEEPADPRMQMFAPEHRRKGQRPTSLTMENEEILDELAQSELSYPHDEQARKASGPRRSVEDRYRREGSLENFGSQGWRPTSPPEQHFAMPSARPAGGNSRQGSRVPSRMEQRRPPSRPASARPTQPRPMDFESPVDDDEYMRYGVPNDPQSNLHSAAMNIAPPALEIDVRAPSADNRSVDSNGVRSLAATDEDLYASPVYGIRRGDAQVAPLKSPSRTPQGLAASVPLPQHRAQGAIGGKVSRPASRMSAQIVRDPYSTPKRINVDVHVRTPRSTVKTPTVGSGEGLPRNRFVDTASVDEHVHGHVHEVVEEEPDVVVVREELEDKESEHQHSYGHVEDEDIGHHAQEIYDVVDNATFRSVTPKAKAIVLAAAEERDLPITEIVDVESLNEHQLVELLKTPGMRSEALDYGDDVQKALDLHHDEDLCVLLQAAEDELQHPVVRKAVRKAIAGRLKKLGLGEDHDSVRKDPRMITGARQDYGSPRSIITTRLPDDAPEWAKRLSESVRELTRQMQVTQLDDKNKPRRIKGKEEASEADDDSLHPGHAIDERGMQYRPDTEADTDGLLNITRPPAGLISPGEMLYDEEVYKLRKRNAQGSPRSHATWEIEEERPVGHGNGSIVPGEDNGMPEIPDSDYYRSSPNKGNRGHRRQDSNSQTGANTVTQGDTEGMDWIARYSGEPNEPPPWLKVNQRLLNWAVIWPFSELENSLKSCERGEQVDEVALTIWTTQMYKRYIRAQMTQYPPQKVDKMFVPPNIADAINNAAYNGRHEEVAVMLRELWAPFGLKGHPKLILALTRHRREDNHWVVHRFSLPDASIITYDTYLEKSLPDGRPLGWWFGIRIAFANDAYPPPDQVIQRMIRLHRPLQLQVDNSLAAAAIWRNLIMGTKADRLVDLERLRDLVRQEVKGIRGKKEQGKLSLGLPKATYSSDPRMIEA